MERNLTIKTKDAKFDSYLEVLIKKYEFIVTHTVNEIFTFFGLMVTSIVTFIIADIGWSIPSLKSFLLVFWNANIIVKLIIFCVCFTIWFFTFRFTIWFMRRKFVENQVLKFLRISDLAESSMKLNKLYLAKIEKDSWILEIKIDDEKGVLELTSIKRLMHENV